MSKHFFVFIILLVNISNNNTYSQLLNFDLNKLRQEWGAAEFRQANTTRFAVFMGRSQKRTILYMNLARQDGDKFRSLVIAPYIEEHPDKKAFDLALKSKGLQPLRPSLRLWLAALPHSTFSGLGGYEGHQGFNFRMAMTLNLGTTGENCSYGYFTGLDVTLQLLNSPPHKANILNPDYYRAGVTKFIHIKYGWNSVTTFSGPKYSDMLFRNAFEKSNWFFALGMQTNFSKFMLEPSFGKKYVSNVMTSKWSVGSQFFFTSNKTSAIPLIKLESSFYYFSLGLNLQAGFSDHNIYGLIRPEISAFFPYSIGAGYMEYLNLDNNKASIGLGYSYVIPVYNQTLLPSFISPHTIELKWRRNFGFVDKTVKKRITKNH